MGNNQYSKFQWASNNVREIASICFTKKQREDANDLFRYAELEGDGSDFVLQYIEAAFEEYFTKFDKRNKEVNN